jgi:hypothetical protein
VWATIDAPWRAMPPESKTAAAAKPDFFSIFHKFVTLLWRKSSVARKRNTSTEARCHAIADYRQTT